MKFSDYTVDLEGIDVDELISEWKWAVPSGLKVVATTKFGDSFLISEDNRVVFLDTLDGSLSDCGKGNLFSDGFVEENRERFSADWVEICIQRGMLLEAGQCYGWKVHPIIGGKFAFENIKVFSLRVYESVTGQLVRQVTGKPQGYQVTGFTTGDEK
jgi:hypothetical protein